MSISVSSGLSLFGIQPGLRARIIAILTRQTSRLTAVPRLIKGSLWLPLFMAAEHHLNDVHGALRQ